MAQPAKFIDRRKLAAKAVSQVDTFRAWKYLRHRQSVPTLAEMEKNGQGVLPDVPAALLDMYQVLWDPEPILKDEVPADQRYWQEMLKATMGSSVYQELHARTKLSDLKAVMGTIAMGTSVLGLIPKKDQEQLQEIAQAQATANEAQEQAEQLQQQAATQQQLADAAAQQVQDLQNAGQDQGQQSQQLGDQQGQPQPGQGQSGQPGSGQARPGKGKPQQGSSQTGQSGGQSGMTLAQAQQIAQQLQAQAQQAKAQAQQARRQANQAQSEANAKAESLLGEAGSQHATQKLRQLASMGLQAIKQANTQVQEIAETLEAWGLDEGELILESIPEAFGLLERMKRNKDWKDFAKILGRIRRMAAKKAKSTTQSEGRKVSKTTYGRSLRKAHRGELVALAHPALKHQAMQRWSRGELRQVDEETKATEGEGPVVVCEDSSGSMNGTKQQWAKAVVLSLAYYAKLKKRSFGWIMFDYGVRQSGIYLKGVLTAKQLLHIADARSGGGTNFEAPLKKAVEMIEREGLKKADICFITDGEAPISPEFLKWLLTKKKELEFNIIVILCDVGSASIETVQKFADKVEAVSEFTAETAGKQVIAHLS